MAHYVQVPKDLNEIKEKFILGFTKRQVICFGIGLVLGAPVYFLTRNTLGMSGAIFAMGAVAAPAILCGLYKKNGVFLEKKIRFMYEYFTRPRKRYYRSTNIFMCIERHIEYNRIKKKLEVAERKHR
ncbi:MAG: PrgI family protein [Oscillospiraceae bacterium]|nr:PrgI family protein [Oscillospiraceae bacterium]MBR3536714.1 PrgI family protein [Oscillospiraceae bacterium]MBR6834376.1 PrgI family protein [Oscillospiraceae bacterium]